MYSSTEYEIETIGEPERATYRAFFKKRLPSSNSKIYVSPFHDIPLYSEAGSNIYRMVVEVPRWTNQEFEIAKDEPFNPIRHKVDIDTLKFDENVFPFHGFIWNYGSLTQTWEMPGYRSPQFDLPGDNSLINVIEIGNRVHQVGSIVDVKILGALALVDNNVLDWKIVVIDVKDDLAASLDNIKDVESIMPGLLCSTVEWFRFYQTPKGVQPLQILMADEDEYFFDRTKAYEIIETSHKFWLNLIKNELFFKQSKECSEFKLLNTQCDFSMPEACKTEREAARIIDQFKQVVLNKPIESLARQPPRVDLEKSYFLRKSELLAKLGITKAFKSDEIQLQTSEPRWSMWESIKEHRYKIGVPLSIALLLGYLFYFKRITK